MSLRKKDNYTIFFPACVVIIILCSINSGIAREKVSIGRLPGRCRKARAGFSSTAGTSRQRVFSDEWAAVNTQIMKSETLKNTRN